jgi:proline iminopeptidase
VSDLEELREGLGIDRFDLLGHSHGGFVAVQYAATHPERVRRLVLAATAPRLAPEYRDASEAVWEASSDTTVRSAREARARRSSAKDLDPGEIIRLVMLELRLYFARADGVPVMGQVFEREPPNLDALLYFNRETAPQFDLRPLLSAVRAQTLVITGDHDFLVKAAADELVSGIADARRVVLREAGHFLWIDQPQAFASEVAAFLLR